MRRRRLTVLGAFLMLLCILTAFIWIRSYSRTDDWFLIYQTDGSERVSTLGGQIMIRHDRAPQGNYGGIRRISHRSDPVASLPPRPWNENLLEPRWLIFRYIDYEPGKPTGLPAYNPVSRAIRALQQKPQLTQQERATLTRLQIQLMMMAPPPTIGEDYWEIVFPLWLPPAIFLIPVLLLWVAAYLRRGYRRRRGLCAVCGYDLRASPGKCPECGAACVRRQSSSAPLAT